MGVSVEEEVAHGAQPTKDWQRSGATRRLAPGKQSLAAMRKAELSAETAAKRLAEIIAERAKRR